MERHLKNRAYLVGHHITEADVRAFVTLIRFDIAYYGLFKTNLARVRDYEYVYDYMGRRVEKKVYSGSTGNWSLDEHWKFVYDGYLQIEELDALSGDTVGKKRIWSNGKIISDIHGSSVYYALRDANKNIMFYETQ